MGHLVLFLVYKIIKLWYKQAIHGIIGFLVIVLMIFHVSWAMYVLCKNYEKKKEALYKFSITVWLTWLVPYIVGMFIGIAE